MPTPDPQEMLARLLGPNGPELSCEACFEELDGYVELQLSGEPGGDTFRACGRTWPAARRVARSTPASSPSWVATSPTPEPPPRRSVAHTPTFSLTVIPSATDPLAVPSWVE